MRKFRLLKALNITAIVVAGTALLGWIVERLWNWLVPAIVGWRPISFAQAVGLLILSKILFGGFHRHGVGRRGWRRGMEERLAAMSPEDRERFRAGLRGRPGCRWNRAQEPNREEAAR